MDIERELRRDLKELRSGYGVWRSDFVDRFGRRLRSQLGVADSALSSVRARELVREMIDVLLADYADAQLALRVAVALHPVTREMRTLDERMRWLAGELKYCDRTARRRVDEAIALLAQAIIEAGQRGLSTATRRGAPGEVGYVMESLRTEIKLFGEQPRVEEWREVRALMKLSAICCKFSLPEPPDGVDREVGISVLGGGELDYRPRPGNVVEFSVEPPRPLEEDDEHRFGVGFQFPPGQQMPPYYAVHPATRFRFFDLTVHFDLRRLPSRVWKIDGVLHPQTGSYQPGMEELTPDSSGIVRVRFENLPEGKSHGLGWAWRID